MASNNWDYWLRTPNCEVTDNFIPARAAHGMAPWNGSDFNFFSFLDLNSSLTYFKAVEKCPPLAAVVDNLASAYANGCCEVLSRTTDNYVRGQKKAWQQLMDKPNPTQTRTDFRKQIAAFAIIAGYCYIEKDYAVGFSDIPSALWIIDPCELEVESIRNTKFDRRDLRGWRKLYRVTEDGMRTELDESNLILIVGNNISRDQFTKLPNSKLKSLQKPISNIIAELDARNNLITKRGALGVFSNEGATADGSALPMTEDKKREVVTETQRIYGITGNRSPFGVVSSRVKWQQVSMNVKDLQLHEEHLASTSDICDRLGYPFYLMGGKDGTFSNVAQAEKALYQNAIMPLAAAIDEALNNGLNTIADNAIITTDFSHVESLQEGKKEDADAARSLNQSCQIEWNNGLITLNDWKRKIGDDVDDKNEMFNLTKPLYDQYLRDNGIIEVNPPIKVDNVTP